MSASGGTTSSSESATGPKPRQTRTTRRAGRARRRGRAWARSAPPRSLRAGAQTAVAQISQRRFVQRLDARRGVRQRRARVARFPLPPKHESPARRRQQPAQVVRGGVVHPALRVELRAPGQRLDARGVERERAPAVGGASATRPSACARRRGYGAHRHKRRARPRRARPPRRPPPASIFQKRAPGLGLERGVSLDAQRVRARAAPIKSANASFSAASSARATRAATSDASSFMTDAFERFETEGFERVSSSSSPPTGSSRDRSLDPSPPLASIAAAAPARSPVAKRAAARTRARHLSPPVSARTRAVTRPRGTRRATRTPAAVRPPPRPSASAAAAASSKRPSQSSARALASAAAARAAPAAGRPGPNARRLAPSSPRRSFSKDSRTSFFRESFQRVFVFVVVPESRQSAASLRGARHARLDAPRADGRALDAAPPQAGQRAAVPRVQAVHERAAAAASPASRRASAAVPRRLPPRRSGTPRVRLRTRRGASGTCPRAGARRTRIRRQRGATIAEGRAHVRRGGGARRVAGARASPATAPSGASSRGVVDVHQPRGGAVGVAHRGVPAAGDEGASRGEASASSASQASRAASGTGSVGNSRAMRSSASS